MDESSRQFRPFVIGLVLIDGFALMSYAAVVEPLRAANLLAPKILGQDYLQSRPLYQIRHISPAGDKATSSSGAVVPATALARVTDDFDLVLVFAGGDPVAFKDPGLFRWLRRLAAGPVALGGVSGGPVVLAFAGVMEGRRMTVHWEHAETLAEISPELMIERSLYVIDRDRMTCAGGIAPLDMMHAFLSERHGAEFTGAVSDWFMHTDIRPSGGPQRAGLVARYGSNTPAVIAAIEAMENHIADPLSLGQLAIFAGVSPRQLNRLFNQNLWRSTMKFYGGIRLAKARDLISQTTLSITQIALATGFSSSSHFSQNFHAAYGRPPSSLRP